MATTSHDKKHRLCLDWNSSAPDDNKKTVTQTTSKHQVYMCMHTMRRRWTVSRCVCRNNVVSGGVGNNNNNDHCDLLGWFVLSLVWFDNSVGHSTRMLVHPLNNTFSPPSKDKATTSDRTVCRRQTDVCPSNLSAPALCESPDRDLVVESIRRTIFGIGRTDSAGPEADFWGTVQLGQTTIGGRGERPDRAVVRTR